MSLIRWSPEELDKNITSTKHVLVDLRADWCPQCGPQEQVVERVTPTYKDKIVFGSVDVGAYPEISERFGIKGLPALLLFRDGNLQDTLAGFKSAPLLKSLLDGFLAGK